jgi:aldehyde dehydrogenase (NAD+)
MSTITTADATLTNALTLLRKQFQSGITQPYAWRKAKLEQLRSAILQHETAIYAALAADLHKSREEAWVTEIGMVLAEISHTLKHLHSWMRPKRVATNLLNLPSSSFIYKEPLGTVLIIGPWNFPFLLLLGPLVGALAAGNTVVLKPSEYAPATAALVQQLIQTTFAPDEVLVVAGDGAVVVPGMMQEFSFDHVFFTGGTAVGKIIYELAASKLVPVTLELGGKSPCIVEADANLDVAARRIVVTKFVNAGQMCIAPDYLLVHHEVKDRLIEAMKAAIRQFYSDDPVRSDNFGRIINERQYNRLTAYLQQGKIIIGGECRPGERFISPTLMEEVSLDAPIMKEEIFGPILPILPFSSREEALAIIAKNPNPLSFSIYTNSTAKEEAWLSAVRFGGGCVNNSSWQYSNPNLPFGGRGFSGIGAAHGKYSFDCFTHQKAVLKTPTWFDPAIKYPPLTGKLSLLKKLLR